MNKMNTKDNMNEMNEPADERLLPSREEFDELVRNANTGDPRAYALLGEFLERWPHISEHLGSLAKHVQNSLILAIAGTDQLMVASTNREIDSLRTKLASGAEVSPLEALAIERVVACWLLVQGVDIAYPSTKPLPLPTARFVVQLRESSQRRFDAATKSLANLKRLLAETPAARRAALVRLQSGA